MADKSPDLPASPAEATPAFAALAPEQKDALAFVDATAAARTSAIGAAVDAWLAEHIHNSPLAQATAAYNHLVERLPALKAAIVAAVEKEI